MNRENSGTFVVGGVLLTIGVALLVDRMGVLPWTGHWSVWPLLLIGYGVANLAESPWRGARGVFPIALGLWLWSAEAGWIDFRTSWPVVFVLLGLAVMWQTWAAPHDAPDQVLDPRRRRNRSPLVAFAIIAAIMAATTIDAGNYGWRNMTAFSSSSSSTTGDRLHVMAMMGQAQRSPVAAFKGADMVTVMGQTTLDLRQAVVPDGDDVVVDVFGLMGSTIIRVPASWSVDARAFPLMGEIDDRRGTPESVSRSRIRSRGRSGDDWMTDTPSNPSNGGGGGLFNGSGGGGGGSAPASDAPAAGETAKPHRLVLTGFVTMGNIIIR